jgi:cytidylate kinase
MRRVVILGPGAAGKSTLARQLSTVTGLRVIELDKIFWGLGLVAMPRHEWCDMQRKLVEEDCWILDGDLGPYDAVEVRLRAADTVIFLDFPIAVCAWRAFRRSREQIHFWWWLLRYGYRSRPYLMTAIAEYAPSATVYRLRNPAAAARLIREVSCQKR